MTITSDKIVADCVSENYRSAPIFKKHNIDFCCGGKVSIQEACLKSGVSESMVIQELNEVMNHPSERSVEEYELDALSDHIVDKHHKYVRERILEIDPFLEKVLRVHGEKHPELKKVHQLFHEVKEELLIHMDKEERVLFPYVREMVQAKKENIELKSPSFGSIKNPINVMERDHEVAGDAFKEIRELTNNLIPPENACNTYRVAFSLLEEFENDLHRHVHLENNILFPKAISLENELMS